MLIVNQRVCNVTDCFNSLSVLFSSSGDVVPESQASVLASMSSLEVRYVADDCVRAVSGSLGQAKVVVKAHGMSCTRFVLNRQVKLRHVQTVR